MRGCRGQEGSHDRTKSGKRSDLCMGQRTRVAFSVEKEMRPNVIPFPLSPLHPHQPARIQPSLPVGLIVQSGFVSRSDHPDFFQHILNAPDGS